MDKMKNYWFIMHKDQILVTNNGGEHRIPLCGEPPIELKENTTIHTIGTLDSHPCKAIEISEPIEGAEMVGLRASFDILPWDEYYTAGKAAQILNWDRNSRFCPQCGAPTPQIAYNAKKCPICGQEFYPRISPATIVLIKRGDSILLVHARNFKSKVNGLVAGFLEVGETLEDCVRREVMEETGLKIENIRYFGNQPWPYPSGLMVGFVADYVDGEINLQEEELTSGAFYTRENLPAIPSKLSIARRLIDAWCTGEI